MGWAENAVYCKATQVLKIDEHALAKSKNEQFRMVVSGKTVNFDINSFSGGTNSFQSAITEFAHMTPFTLPTKAYSIIGSSLLMLSLASP